MTNLLSTLRPSAHRYHEVFSSDGQVHPHWAQFAEALNRLTPAQMQQRSDLVNRQVQENGVTYNLYGDSQGPDRSWRVGPIPQLIAQGQWQGIASGVAQRARLLNALLVDLYGPQTLIAQGLLPSELIFGHHNYLWPCHGMRPANDTWLHVVGVDLARSADGQWWVMADRTQAPSGAGYALENRQVVARAFPALYRELGVEALTGYFQSLMRTLRQQVPSTGEPPLIVLLTPGRFNETYFEHVYLARHLGIPLVEGHDLSVRQPNVYLKTLSGLKRVHAIFRRLDDDYCDPLELRGDSALGVPGLLAVARAGNVLIANALGSGVLESQGLLSFLPKACEHLLGEKLELPAIATWWCGEPPVMEEALARLPELVIKGAFPSQHFTPVFGRDLDARGLAAMRQRIRERPYAYLAQETVAMAQTPIWQGETKGFENHATGMRVYAVATANGYEVMPGGLTRVAGRRDDEVVSMQRGGTSKDTWVCFSEQAATEFPRLRTLGVRDLQRQDPYLPSRLAENLFWLGRYAERTDHHARLIRSALSRYLEADPSQGIGLILAQNHGQKLGLLSGNEALDIQLLDSIGSANHGQSVVSTLRALIGSAAEVRSRLSHENWIAIVELEQEAVSLDPTQEAGAALGFLDRLLMSLSSLAGFALDDMTQDQSWRFLMLGRRIERLQKLCALLCNTLPLPHGHSQAALDWLLDIADSRITYRSRYLSSAQLIPVLDLLLLDPGNPHSVAFQLRQIVQLLTTVGSAEHRTMSELEAQLLSLDLAVIESDLAFPQRLPHSLATLAKLLAALQQAAWDLADKLSLQYFAHIERQSQSMVST